MESIKEKCTEYITPAIIQTIQKRTDQLFEKKYLYCFSDDDDGILKASSVLNSSNTTLECNHGNTPNEGVHGDKSKDRNLKWDIPEYMRMKEEMNLLKCSLNDKDVIQWHIHTKKVNPAKRIVQSVLWDCKAEFCTQAWLKFYEIASNYIHTDINMPYFSVHLCEAPGAFITSLHHYLYSTGYKGDWRWLATTYNTYYEGNNVGEMIEDDRFIRNSYDNWYFGVDGTGNLMSRKNMEGLKEMLSDIHVNLVTADGSIDCQKEPAEQENIVSWLQHCEALTALQILSPGGTFVLKMFTMFECTSVSLMYLLNCFFKEVNLFKPCCSKGGNSEVYVVCTNYKGRELYKDFLNGLVPVYFSDKRPSGCIFKQSEIPASFFAEHTKCLMFFQEHQKAAIQRNLDLHVDHSNEKKAQLTLEQDLCVKTFLKTYFVKPLPKFKRLLKLKGKEFRIPKRKSRKEPWETEFAKRVRLDGRLTGSLQDRQNEALLSWKEKVMTFETYKQEVEKEGRFSNWIENQGISARDIDIDGLEPVTGLKISDIQNSPFCQGRVVGQVREIIANVEWLADKLERNPAVFSSTVQSLRQTIESYYDTESQTFIVESKPDCDGDNHSERNEETRYHGDQSKNGKGCSELENRQSTCRSLKKDDDDCVTDEREKNDDDCVTDEREKNDDDCVTDEREKTDDDCFTDEREKNDDDYVTDKREKNDDDCVTDEQEKNGEGLQNPERELEIKRLSENGDCVSIKHVSGGYLTALEECLSNAEMKSRLHLYSCTSEIVRQRYELCDQLKLLETVIDILKKSSPGDLVVIETGTCLTRISASLLHLLYKTFCKIGFLHHHGNYLQCHLVCVSFQSCPIQIVEYLQSVLNTMRTDQPEAVLEIFPILTVLNDEEFSSFLQNTNIRLLKSFVTTTIEREKRLLHKHT